MEKKAPATTAKEDEPIKPIKAKIVAVTTLRIAPLSSDSVLCGFEFNGKKIAREFISPFLNDKNLKLWRKLTFSVLTGKKPANVTDASLEFEKYKSTIMNQEVYITYDDDVEGVLGIGHSVDNMFYPEAYGLLDTIEEK